MSNTSDQTTQQSKTRLIIDEIGVDTETGIIGRGHSHDNGKTFTVDKTIYGRIFHKSDHDQVWKGIQDKVKTVVEPAKSAADSAVAYANDAIENSRVNSQAIDDINSAVSDAKQGANDAMSRAKSAWDVATGAKEAVTDFDPLIKSAQSDASKALAQIADTANALSDAKTVFSSDVAEAKQLASTAQTTADSAVESAGENAKALTSQANALSDVKKAMDSGVASATGLANAAQTTANNAIKSASSVANDLAAVASQAKSNASGITKVTSDVGLLQTTVADNSGNISKIQETAAQIQQAVSDNSGAIVVAKQTADSAATVASDAKSNATVAVQTASGASVTAKNAQGDATTAMATANSAVIQASDAKSNATIAVQTASEASLTATNAQGDASIAKQTASDASVQIKNAQGDISKLQTRAGAIETSVANNSGAIADVQATANQLKASVSDNAGNITITKQTADSAVTVASDAKSNATVAIQTASQASITAQNASGQAASAVLTANGAMTTASDAKSNATVAVQTASGASLTATNANNDATVAKQTASEAKVQASNAESDFAQLSIRAGQIEASVANNSGAIASVQQTANGLTTTVGKVDDRVKNIEDTTNWTTKTGPLDMNTLTTTQNIYYRDSNLKNADGETGWAYIQVVSMGERVTQTVWHDRLSIQHTRTGAVSGSSYNWDAWNKVATNAQVVQVKQTVDGISTTINDPKTGLNATYQTAAGNATTISNVKSDVYQLQTTANGLTSRVGNLESKTNTQETAIEQNKNAITLKADQTDVNTLKGNVTSLQSEVTTQANQIQTKVSASDVSGMLTGYATQTYTQSLITQKANEWNLNLTSLKTNVDAIKANGGGVNLANGTSSEDQSYGDASKTTGWNIATIATLANPQAGQQYTISVNTRTNGGSWRIQVWDGTSPTQRGKEVYGAPPTTAEEQKHITTITWPNGSNKYMLVQLVNNNDGGQITWNSAMLEEGTVVHTWSPAPSDMATVTSVTNLSATVDGIQAQVYNSDGSSRITQLSNLIATKVSSDDFNNLSKSVNLQTLDSADINTMKTNGHYFVHNLANTPISGWVYVDVVGNGTDRIRQDVYQDTNNQHCYRRLNGSSWTAWSQGATESEITQLSDDINLRVKSADLISQINLQAGATLIQSNKLVLDAGTTVITGEAFIPDAAISEINTDKLFFSDTSGNKSFMSTNLGALDPMAPANSLSIRYKTGYEVTTSDRGVFFMMGQDYTRYAVRSKYSDKFSGIWASDTEAYLIEEGQGLHLWAPGKDQSAWALYNSNNVGIRASLATTNAIEVGKADDGYAYNTKMDTSPTATTLYINGWEWVAGYVEAMGHSQHSILSAKTRIEQADSDHMLDLINQTELTTFAYKSELADGTDHRHIGPIIDDINDVAQYKIPSEFVAPTKTARDDGNIVGALIGAVQALTKRIKTLEDKA